MPAFPAGFSDLASVSASTKFLADDGSANGLGSAAQIRSYLLGLANAWSANGAASTPPVSLTGTWFTGGTATTTKPQLLIEPAGTTSTAWSTAGTGLGVNAPSGFTGSLLDLQINGTSNYRFLAASAGITVGGAWNDFTLTLPNGGGSRFFTISEAGTARFNISNGIVSVQQQLSFASGSVLSADTSINREAAHVLAMRSAANAQTWRVYGTYTDASNYRRLQLGSTTAGVFHIRPEGAGTGASGNVLHISGLPTSNPGPGILWNNAGSVAIGT